MNNYKLKIQYDGTNYSGWQIQENSLTIQQEITEKIKILLKEEVNLIGSGRTDSGVHALGQIANFRTQTEIDVYKFQHSLNSLLPLDISVSEMQLVDENFHARFDAKKRSYIYLLTGKKSPFYNRYSYFYHSDINLIEVNKLADLIKGEKDFSAFCKKNSEVENKVCNVSELRVKRSGELIIFYISANRFLHGMVRAIVGTLLHSLKENNPKSLINKIISSKDRETAGEAVPAKGLFLYKVEY